MASVRRSARRGVDRVGTLGPVQHRPRGYRVLARVVFGTVVAFTVGACGPTVAYERASAVDVAEHVEPSDSSTVQEPTPQWAHETRSPDPLPHPRTAPSPPRWGSETRVPETTALPATATSLRPESDSCDWHANLERARSGRLVDWIILDTGAWGRAEVPGNRIWIAPRTPCDKVYSVAVHEWTHHMQGVVYGDWRLVTRELAPYGGAEVVADCGALILEATWIRYGCVAQESRDAASAILRGIRA